MNRCASPLTHSTYAQGHGEDARTMSMKTLTPTLSRKAGEGVKYYFPLSLRERARVRDLPEMETDRLIG